MEYDELKHFEKLLDEFEEDALAVTREGKAFPSSSRKIQRDLTRRNVLAFVEGIVLEKDKTLADGVELSRLEDSLEAMQKERDLLHEYLYDAVEGMSPYDLSQASDLIDLNYCKTIIDKAEEFVK